VSPFEISGILNSEFRIQDSGYRREAITKLRPKAPES
jgi:hypothetical protein